ncbi:hypothetical protein Tco_1049976, partial [Tanacetum coccineum]
MNDSRPGVVRPLSEENIKFEFWGQCSEELKENMSCQGPGYVNGFSIHPERGLAHAITIRSGLNYKPPKNPFENITNPQDKPETKENATKNVEEAPDDHRKSVESCNHTIPFPVRLKKKKEKEQFRKFFENLQQLGINIPFFEALEQMPKYGKFMKDLLSRKGKTKETSKITLNERCSAVLLN